MIGRVFLDPLGRQHHRVGGSLDGKGEVSMRSSSTTTTSMCRNPLGDHGKVPGTRNAQGEQVAPGISGQGDGRSPTSSRHRPLYPDQPDSKTVAATGGSLSRLFDTAARKLVREFFPIEYEEGSRDVAQADPKLVPEEEPVAEVKLPEGEGRLDRGQGQSIRARRSVRLRSSRQRNCRATARSMRPASSFTMRTRGRDPRRAWSGHAQTGQRSCGSSSTASRRLFP